MRFLRRIVTLPAVAGAMILGAVPAAPAIATPALVRPHDVSATQPMRMATLASSIPPDATHVYVHLRGTDPIHYTSGYFYLIMGGSVIHVGYGVQGLHGGPATMHIKLMHHPSYGADTVEVYRAVTGWNFSGVAIPVTYYSGPT